MEEVEVHVETFYNELWESNGFLTQAQIVLPPFDEDTSIGAGHVCVQIVFGKCEWTTIVYNIPYWCEYSNIITFHTPWCETFTVSCFIPPGVNWTCHV
jgi:hypothetical protein